MATEPQPVRITVSIPGAPVMDLTLSYPLDPGHGEILREVHDRYGGTKVIECRMHDDDPRLADLRDSDARVRGIWMALCDHPTEQGRLYLRHYPNGPAGRGRHDVPRPMTEEHIRGQEYIAERGSEFGYRVVVNRAFSTENLCRADVRVHGSEAVLAAEIQVSHAGTANVLRRTREAARDGATSVWFPRMENTPDWSFKVPTVSTNKVESRDPRTWTVTTGPRALEDERCTPTSRFQVCPVRKRGHCGLHHPLWVPMAVVERKLAVDDIVEQLPDGGLVRFDAGKPQGVILTTPEDRDRWLVFEAEKAAVPPPTRVPRQREQGGVRHAEHSAERLRAKLERDASRRPTKGLCERCTAALAAKYLPPDFGACERCRPLIPAALLADPRAGRLCSVCGKPLPRAAVHATAHFDCRRP